MRHFMNEKKKTFTFTIYNNYVEIQKKKEPDLNCVDIKRNSMK